MSVQPSHVHAAFDSGYLNLILFPTEACNFRCTYCYEDFALAKMRPAVVEGVKNLISRRAGDLEALEISWFGGEPMLAKNIVLDLGRHADALAAASGFSFGASMSTNGYFLDPSSAREIVASGVRSFHVSLDGPEWQHDKSRRHANGGGTFSRIWTNLRSIHKSALEVSVILRIHVSPDNVATLEELVGLVNADLGADERFKVYFHPIERLGGAADASLRVFDGDASERVTAALSRLVHPAHQEPSAPAEPYVCYAAKPNSLAIRADGRVAKCTVALRDERNCVGTLRPDGMLELSQDRLRYWFRGWASLDEAQLACPLA